MTRDHAMRPVAAFVAGSLVLALSLATPLPALAECGFGDPWPSFRAVAPTAARIVVGRVVGAGYTPLGIHGFRLEAIDVVRGRADPTIDFRELRPPAPLRCPDSALRPHIGDVIAVAIDGRLAGHVGHVTTVAYVAGTPDSLFGTGIEQLTVADVQTIAALPATDAEGPHDAGSNDFAVAAVVLAAVIAAVLAFVRPPKRVRPDTTT